MLYLKLGTVNSRKSLNMLATIHEYEGTNKSILVAKSSRDTRNKGYVASRALHYKKECETFNNEVELLNMIEKLDDKTTIFIDEVQFCSLEECEIIKVASQKHNILCYGLLSDYTGKTFEAVSTLIAEMPSIEWIKSMCVFCDNAAKMNLRLVDWEPVYTGDAIIPEWQLGKDEYFKVCQKCYYSPPDVKPDCF